MSAIDAAVLVAGVIVLSSPVIFLAILMVVQMEEAEKEMSEYERSVYGTEEIDR